MTVSIITYGILAHKYRHRHTDTCGRNERASEQDNTVDLAGGEDEGLSGMDEGSPIDLDGLVDGIF